MASTRWLLMASRRPKRKPALEIANASAIIKINKNKKSFTFWLKKNARVLPNEKKKRKNNSLLTSAVVATPVVADENNIIFHKRKKGKEKRKRQNWK